MPLDAQILPTIVLALAVAVVVLAVWVAWLQRSDALLRRRLRRLFGEGEGVGLDELLDRQFRRLDTVAERVDALNKLHHELEALSQQSIQKVGVIRFNPFADTGGDQSFAVALLDADGNGVVLSSLHGRADTRIFAKQVQAGRSKHALSDEEQDAIRKALSPAGAGPPRRPRGAGGPSPPWTPARGTARGGGTRPLSRPPLPAQATAPPAGQRRGPARRAG